LSRNDLRGRFRGSPRFGPPRAPDGRFQAGHAPRKSLILLPRSNLPGISGAPLRYRVP